MCVTRPRYYARYTASGRRTIDFSRALRFVFRPVHDDGDVRSKVAIGSLISRTQHEPSGDHDRKKTCDIMMSKCCRIRVYEAVCRRSRVKRVVRFGKGKKIRFKSLVKGYRGEGGPNRNDR